jgi:2-keto-4-pentenoate hydratase/2-oxohepta-3-ene-1,7-dioic acid hydratase in catechol pathway
MRFCRFDDNRLGVVVGDQVRDVTEALGKLSPMRYPAPPHDALIAGLDALRPEMERLSGGARAVPLAQVQLLSPVANPGKIIAAPVNYRKHLEEALADKGIHHGNLVQEIHKAGMFLKATSSLVGPGEGVKLVHLDRRNDHEVELAVVIGKRGRNIPKEQAMQHVAGYCIGLDITIRGPEERSLRKSPDSYCVLGPWLATRDEIADPGSLSLKIDVNGVVKQDAHTSDLILSVAQLIEWGSSFYTLHPGDVLLTGTPQGVGPVRPGDVMSASVERIGTMRVAVSAA